MQSRVPLGPGKFHVVVLVFLKSPLRWLHDKSRLSRQKNVTVVESVMVWYFKGFYMIYRKLRGRLEVQNFFSLVEKYFTRSRTLEEKFRISM